MTRTRAGIIVAQLEELLAAGKTVSIEGSEGSYEVTVFEGWLPGNRRHSHYAGATLSEAFNRAQNGEQA